MKGTIMMLAFVATAILTWMFFSTIIYLCSENVTFKECAVNGPMVMLMLVFGWVPSAVVCDDLEKKLE